jgi:hypothetical protein
MIRLEVPDESRGDAETTAIEITSLSEILSEILARVDLQVPSGIRSLRLCGTSSPVENTQMLTRPRGIGERIRPPASSKERDARDR